MKLSLEWLSDFVDLSGISAQEVAEKLTMGAFEVEEIELHGPDIQGTVIVGEIVEIQPHPNADKIRLTKIKFDEQTEPKEIVCGAWNIEPGQRIPVALPGAKVINRHDGTALQIKESKIRGVTSNGMLCSAPELGTNGDGEGILILPKDTPLGCDVKKLLNLTQDSILHVEPRSNRGDAQCVLGMAREVAALFGRPLKSHTWLDEFRKFIPDEKTAKLEISVADESDCPFFSARIITGLTIAQSPSHIIRRLEAIGLRPVNNIVDITNYVLHELGQPLHAYDLSLLNGPSLQVRRGSSNEKLVTIDGKERELNGEITVIADSSSPVGVAGVMGGKLSEISEKSQAIALEAASFASSRVRRSSRLLGLSSDSSLRFERGVDTTSVRYCSDRAAYLIVKYGNGILGPISACGNDEARKETVRLHMSELKRLTEIEMAPDAVCDLLEPLGFSCQLSADNYSPGFVDVSIPSFRQKDVSREIDLIEEVCRLWGYNRIPVSMPKETVAALPPDHFTYSIRQNLSASGLNEIWTSSLTGSADLQLSQSKTGHLDVKLGQSTTNNHGNAVAVLNPLSAEHQVLRQSLLPGLLKVASYNQGRGRQDIWLFELGRAYFQNNDAQPPEGIAPHKYSPTQEDLRVAAFISGDPHLSPWLKSKESQTDAPGFFALKGILENLCHRLGISLDDLSFEHNKNEEQPGWLHPGRSCRVSIAAPKKKDKGKPKTESRINLGWLGEVHPVTADFYEIKGRSYAFELDCNNMRRAAAPKTMQEIYATPTMVRDLTVDLAMTVRNNAVQSCITETGSELLKRIELVSVYPQTNQRSLSYRLTFQDPKETLTAEQVDALMSKIRDQLKSRLSANFRL